MEHQAVKKDHGKLQLNLVPLEILEPLAMVREFAVGKYGIDGIEAWREISDERLLAAMLRHTVAYQKDNDALDEESGLPAIYHVAINAAFLAIKTRERLHRRELLDMKQEGEVRYPKKDLSALEETAKRVFGRYDEDWREEE